MCNAFCSIERDFLSRLERGRANSYEPRVTVPVPSPSSCSVEISPLSIFMRDIHGAETSVIEQTRMYALPGNVINSIREEQERDI